MDKPDKPAIFSDQVLGFLVILDKLIEMETYTLEPEEYEPLDEIFKDGNIDWHSYNEVKWTQLVLENEDFHNVVEGFTGVRELDKTMYLFPIGIEDNLMILELINDNPVLFETKKKRKTVTLEELQHQLAVFVEKEDYIKAAEVKKKIDKKIETANKRKKK